MKYVLYTERVRIFRAEQRHDYLQQNSNWSKMKRNCSPWLAMLRMCTSCVEIIYRDDKNYSKYDEATRNGA